MAIPAWAIGAGSGFLVGGPVGAVIGGVGATILTPKVPTATPVMVTNTPGGGQQIAPIGPEVPVDLVPAGVANSASAAADLINDVIRFNPVAPDAIDYQPFPAAYAPFPSLVPGSELGGMLDDLKGALPWSTLAAVGAAVAGLVYLSTRRR
jgi:hypothetical protein